MNYFKLLNLETSYKIDLNLLNQRYLERQMQYHPDNAKSNQEKEQFLSLSIDLNKAYSTLKDDLGRAEHLVSLDGIDWRSVDCSNGEINYTLEKIWNDLEKLEECEELSILTVFYSQKAEQRKAVINNLQEAFEQKQLAAMQNNIIELRYLNNLINSIKVKIENANTRN